MAERTPKTFLCGIKKGRDRETEEADRSARQGGKVSQRVSPYPFIIIVSSAQDRCGIQLAHLTQLNEIHDNHHAQ